MSKKKKLLVFFLVGFITLGCIFGLIDYKRIRRGELPFFTVSLYSNSSGKQTYVGLGYKIKRQTGVSYKEPLYESTNVKFGLWIYSFKINIEKPAIDNTLTIETTEKNKCSNVAEFYTNMDGFNVYTYCLSSINVFDGTSRVSLKYHINNNLSNLENIINTLKLSASYDDGGSILYKDESSFSNNGLAILKCNTLEGNKDVYIGPKTMSYDKNFCTNDSAMSEYYTFTRTYKVLSVTSSQEENMYYVTLQKYNGETETILASNIISNLTEDKNYEFTFIKPVGDIEDTIDSIFKNSTITNVVETTKEGNDQIQDAIK